MTIKNNANLKALTHDQFMGLQDQAQRIMIRELRRTLRYAESDAHAHICHDEITITLPPSQSEEEEETPLE